MIKKKRIFKTNGEKLEEIVKKVDSMGFLTGQEVHSDEQFQRYLLPQGLLVTINKQRGWYAPIITIEFFDSEPNILPELIKMLNEFSCWEVTE